MSPAQPAMIRPGGPSRDHRKHVSLIVETSHASGRNILRGIARYVREHGPWSIHHEFRNTDEVFPQWLTTWHGDGLIARVENKRIAETMKALGAPVVDLLGTVPGTGFPLVHPDDRAIARMAADHLLERGYRSFAYCGVKQYNWSNRRREGFVDLLREEGYPCAVHAYVPGGDRGWTFEEDQAEMAQWLAELSQPVGIMACSDHHGRLVLNACREEGLKVPDEVAVVGVDNDEPLCEVCDPPLSSVISDDQAVGYRAAALLERMMQGASPEDELLLVPPAHVCTRLSTDTLAIEDQHVAAAVRFIREQACKGITVDDVVTEVHISRSLLQRRFRESLGRTLHEEIVRVRIDQAKFLLEESDMPIALIAEKAGFNHQEYLGAVFKKKVGMTPVQYRRSNRVS